MLLPWLQSGDAFSAEHAEATLDGGSQLLGGAQGGVRHLAATLIAGFSGLQHLPRHSGSEFTGQTKPSGIYIQRKTKSL